MVNLLSVLSAVDAHTAQAIMDNCFNGPITSGRTIILVSHHTALVSPSASYIVALENVRIQAPAFADIRAMSNFPELEMISSTVA